MFNRQGWDQWIGRGSKDAAAKALEFVQSVTKGYAEADPICTPGEFRSIQEIAASAREEAASQRPQ